MKKLLTLLITACFFALSYSLIDQFIWKHKFSWINMITGFITGAVLVLLSQSNQSRQRQP